MRRAVGSKKLCFLDRGLPRVVFALARFRRGKMFFRGNGGATRGADEVNVLVNLAVIVDMGEPAEVTRFANGPIQRGGLEVDLGHDLVDKLERLAAHAVPLIDYGDNRQSACLAHAEEFEGLGLEALRGVDQHDRGIDGGEHAVRVLGEVRVARRVHKVDHVWLRLSSLPGFVRQIFKLERRGRDRDTAVFFHLHPVGHRVFAVALAVDGTGLRDRVRVQRQRFRQRRLTGVGVGDDSERATPGGLREGGGSGAHSVYQG